MTGQPDPPPTPPGSAGGAPVRPVAGGGPTAPSFELPPGAPTGLPVRPAATQIGRQRFEWGRRTSVMGIVNVTPDSFSGDGLLAGETPLDAAIDAAVALGRRMAADGADLLDIGGESSRPGHVAVDVDEERRRVVPVVAALRKALPEMPLSIDTTKAAVAEAAIDAGADLVNDVWGVAADDALLRLVAERGVPVVLMHNRAEARYANLMAEILADLARAIERALGAGVAEDRILIDPGFGFGKTAAHNVVLLRELGALRLLGRPIVLGTSRKSTLGKILDLPPEDRLEATLATTALAVAAGVDVVRVHDVRANIRAARTADAIVRGGWPASEGDEGGPR